MDAKEASRILRRIRELNADPESLLVQAEQVYSMAVDGYTCEVPTKEGVVELFQKQPAVGVQALQFKLATVKWLTELAESAQKDDTISIVVNVKPLEETL